MSLNFLARYFILFLLLMSCHSWFFSGWEIGGRRAKGQLHHLRATFIVQCLLRKFDVQKQTKSVVRHFCEFLDSVTVLRIFHSQWPSLDDNLILSPPLATDFLWLNTHQVLMDRSFLQQPKSTPLLCSPHRAFRKQTHILDPSNFGSADPFQSTPATSFCSSERHSIPLSYRDVLVIRYQPTYSTLSRKYLSRCLSGPSKVPDNLD